MSNDIGDWLRGEDARSVPGADAKLGPCPAKDVPKSSAVSTQDAETPTNIIDLTEQFKSGAPYVNR